MGTFPKEICIRTERSALKPGLLILLISFFAASDIMMSASESVEVLKGYIEEINQITENENINELKAVWNGELEKKYGIKNVQFASDGVAFVRQVKYINSKPVKINICEINTNINKNIEIVPMQASSNIHSKSKLREIAKRNNAIAAINGTYFKQDTGTPLGTFVKDGKIISGPIYERAALKIEGNKFDIQRIAFSGKIIADKKEIKLSNINQPRMSVNDVLIYTKEWGARSPGGLYNISVKDNKVVEHGEHALTIPDGGFVISGAREKIYAVVLSKKIRAEYSLSSGIGENEHIISGGPYLVKDGSVYIDVSAEKLNKITGKNPRTAVGYTAKNVLIAVTVQGRTKDSYGMTLSELAGLMKNLGCIEALNLDGGSSTAMYVKGNVYSGTKISGAQPVNNALIVRNKI